MNISYRIYVEFYLKGKNSSSSIGLDETYATKECAYSMLHSLAKAYGKQIVEDELPAAIMQGGNPVWNHSFTLTDIDWVLTLTNIVCVLFCIIPLICVGAFWPFILQDAWKNI